MESSVDLTGLMEQVRVALDGVQLRIDEWEVLQKSYNNLKEKLTDLPNASCRDVMVPFGKVAMFEAKIKPSSPLLVLLGDNYFMERTSSQSAEMVARRLAHIASALSDAVEQRRRLQTRLAFLSQRSPADRDETVEIREPLDDSAPSASKDRRTPPSQRLEPPTQGEFDAMMAHLDDLDERFRYLDESESLPATSSAAAPRVTKAIGKRLQWREDVATSAAPTSTATVKCADAGERKSILRNRLERPLVDEAALRNATEREATPAKQLVSVSDEVFSGVVKERQPLVSTADMAAVFEIQPAPARPVSKFKKDRMK